jgi:P-type Ca2+ transporter type 2C
MSDWYKEKIDHVFQHVKTDITTGLSEAEARLRYRQQGPNELVGKNTKRPWRIFLAQFSSTVVLVLVASTIISAALGDVKNAFTIGAIVALNALLGFTQEHRAEKALAALKKLAVPSVKVRRDSHLREISARDIVPGDVVVLDVGNSIPADGRIVEAVNLRTQEAALTGESDPIEKSCDALGLRDLPLADRINMVYAGTAVTYGRGLMIVTETGMKTELGRIAAMIQSVPQEATPLQKRLDQLGSRLALVALGIVGVIFSLGLWRGEDLKLMFMTAVSIAVAAVPEGLPAIVTINLAFGAQRLLKRKALIRQLPAVETLGSVTVICTDKTGTLTENKMAAVLLDVAHHQIDLRNAPLNDAVRGSDETPEKRQALDLLLMGGTLCNDSILEIDAVDPSHPHFRAIGDPTETALALVAARYGFPKAELERGHPRVWEFPFDSFRKRMSTVHKIMGESTIKNVVGTSHISFIKGAVDSLLSISSQVFVDGKTSVLGEDMRARIYAAQNSLAQSGMRVIGVAYKPLILDLNYNTLNESTIESDVIFLGLVGLQDPLRQEVNEAVKTCVAAGIKPVMITGDHPLTAQAIANELGFSESHPLIGLELDRFSLTELEGLVDKTSVYARVSPEHKLNIVQALQNRGHVVAMTGDGVNDAPALKKADIGVAMGISGTDVAKESADMVLLDDNFATIVAAVKEGRVIYENIRKFLRYLFTGNVGEIWLMFLAPLVGMPMPLLAVQILWINLITDGIPALALGVEPADRNIMNRPPVSPQENIFGRGMGTQIIWLGFMVGLIPMIVGAWYWHQGNPAWQTMVFTTLIMIHVEMAFAFRSQHDSFFQLPLFSNMPLLAAVIVSILLQLAVVYTPFLQSFFNTVALPLKDLAICLILGTSVFWLIELEKWIRRRRVS